MTKNIFLLSSLLLFIHGLPAQEDVSQVNRPVHGITIDGNNEEWQRPFNLYDGSTGLQFSITNDNARLYLCFTANDEAKARKIMRAGWQIELSSKEKSKKFNAAIVFPVRQMVGFEHKEAEHKFDWKKKSNFAGLVSTYKVQFTNITTSGFKTKNGLRPIIDSTGIEVSIGEDSVQGVVYEVAIPLNELMDEKLIQLNEQMLLHVTVHGLEAPPSGGGGEHSGNRGDRRMAGEGGLGGMNGGMGGMNGGMNNGMNNGGMNAMNNTQRQSEDFSDDGETKSTGQAERAMMFETASFKQKFRLAGN